MNEDASATAELEALLRLQQAETKIRRLEKHLDELPEQQALDEAADKAARAKAAQDTRRVDLQQIESEMRRLEGDLDLLQQRREHEQTRMYGGEISNPRELQAVRAEIESVGKRIESREEELLEVMGRREQLSDEIETLAQRQAELEDQQDELTQARDEAAKGVLADLAEAKAARDRDREVVPDDLLERYDKSKARHSGVGVGRLEGGICSACRLELTPLEISDLRSGDPVGVCPQCQRLIISD